MERRLPSPPPLSRRVPLAVGLGLLLLVATLGFAGWVLRSHASGGSPGASSGAAPRSERRAVAIAYVDAEEGVTSLYPLKPGRVVEVWTEKGQEAEEGKEVPAGTKLFRMEDTAEKVEVAQAEIDLKAAREKLEHAKRLVTQHEKTVTAHRLGIDMLRSKVKQAQSQYEKARRFRKERLGGTEEDVAAAKGQLEEATNAVKAAEARLAAFEAGDPQAAVRLARLDVQAKQEQLRKAQFALGECTVRAPVKGEVLRSNIRVGEVLGPNPRQPAVSFCPGGARIVRAEVEQEFAGRVALGQTARIQDDTTGAGDWRGKVVRISDWYAQRRSILLEPLQFNDVRTLEAIIRLEQDSKGPLRIGQRVRVTLEGNP
jgi:multidrug resistance efflux pump